MNWRIGAILAGLATALAFSPVAAAATIMKTVETAWLAPGADPGDHGRQVIQDAVKQAVAQLVNSAGDAQAVNGGQQDLINCYLNGGSAGATSTIYMEYYASAVDAAISAQLSGPLGQEPDKAGLRVTLGSVAAFVAQYAPDPSALVHTATLLLKDESPAVVYWGEKTVEDIVVAGSNSVTFATQPKILDDLLGAMADAALANGGKPNSEDVVQEAYVALSPQLPPHSVTQFDPAVLPIIVKHNLDLQARRITLYASGIPDAPRADPYATGFLLNQQIWDTLTPDQQLQAMQQVVNFLGAAAAQAAKNQGVSSGAAIRAIQYEAEFVDSLNARKYSVATIAQAVRDINGLTSGSKTENITGDVQTLISAISNIPDFASIKVPTLAP